LLRTGIRTFWTEAAQHARPRVRVAEGVPILALLGVAGALVVVAGPAMQFADDAARSLYERTAYIEAVLGARVRPSVSVAR
jgi:multicomponent K+:H+ antiporter subunit D